MALSASLRGHPPNSSLREREKHMGGIMSVLSILVIVWVVLYVLACILLKHYESNYQEYISLRDGMPKLVGRVYREAERWPMYSRPVLFTKIDHKAQIEFSRVHQAIDEVEILVSEIDEITLPVSSSKKPSLFALNKNAQTIVESSLFLILVNSFAHRILEILNLIKTFSIYLREENNARQSVISSLDRMNEELQKAQAKQQTRTWASTNMDHISWILITTQQCYDTARERIKRISGDGLEYAIAHIYVRIGNASLDYYRVYTDGMEENKRYELDLFGNFIKSSHAFLQAILSNENFSTLLINDLSNWRRLRSADEQLDEFPRRLQEAAESLARFQKERDALETLEHQLEPINIDQEIAAAQKVEVDCTHYWYSYQEKTAFWQAIIGPAKPPTDTLSQLKSELISNITPVLTAAPLKQSCLLNMIDQLENFFVQLLTAKRDLEKLFTELSHHKEAQEKIKVLMHKTTGAAGVAVNKLEIIMKDTSPNLKEDASQLIQIYKIYENRANFVRGADFPELLVKVLEYIEHANICLCSHENLLVKLESDCAQSVRDLKTVLNDISHIMSLTPTIEDQMGNQFALLEKDGRQLLGQFNPAVGYRSLNQYLEITQTWQNEVKRYLDPAKALIQVFKETRLQAINELQATQNQIDQVKYNLQFKWVLVASTVSPEIEKTERKLNAALQDWNRHDGRHWAEMHLRSAIEYCEKTKSNCSKLLNELNEAIATVNKEQRKWQEKGDAIRRIAVKNLYKISEQDRTAVLSLCDIAKAADTQYEVEITLKRAEQIVMNAATPGERKEAHTIINNFHDLDTGGGSFVAGSINTGGGNYVGRDSTT